VFIHFVRFTTRLPHEQVRHLFEERAPRYREVPGLLQKYYGYEQESGAFCGCYLFDSEESRQAFRQSELARSIPDVYEVEEARVEGYEVYFPLYEEPQLAEQAWRTE
jgi:hypothetical protein